MDASTGGLSKGYATVRRWLGVAVGDVSMTEKVVSLLGGAISIFAIITISRDALGATESQIIIGSMGASAVLLFAVPHGQLSQPWAVLGGQTISAVIGVTCASQIASVELAAACAVGLSIGVMHQLKCIHPPGGATALTAVISGPAVADLGYSFVIRPVLLNAAIMVTVAVLFNGLFSWRRYPSWLGRPRNVPPAVEALTHERVSAAVRTIDSFVDVSEDDLVALHQALSAQERSGR